MGVNLCKKINLNYKIADGHSTNPDPGRQVSITMLTNNFVGFVNPTYFIL